MFSDTIVRPTYQSTENSPMSRVETVGVMYLGETVPSERGSAPARAIDSVVRAVGRIVVWVDAAAEVSTAMTRILSSGLPKTWVPRKLRMSSWFLTSASVPM